MRRIVRHYGGNGVDLEDVLRSIARPESPLFASLDPAPERVFVAGLRQSILERIPAPVAELSVALEAVAAAFEPLTLVEKQAAWLESMGYGAEESGAMLRMDFCRLVEVVSLIRGIEPLSEAEAEPFYRALNVDPAKPAGWKRWFAKK